jgi:hypothetical protein
MIHILTVHWKEDRWIDIQLRYLSQWISEPFKVYSFLNELPDGHEHKFFYVSTEPIRPHATKLNLLADMAAFNARNRDDLLMFIDGDAFPIGDVVAFGRKKLERYPLVAIQRRENAGDVQPHPSFCLTTVGFWKEIKGDWKPGYRWRNERGELVTDVGGNVLEALRERSVSWYPMLRSNKHDLHGLWFGLYEDLVYHHGAGFRKPISRMDLHDEDGLAPRNRLSALYWRSFDLLPESMQKKYHPRRILIKRIKAQNQGLSERVFERIRVDSLFFRYFQEPRGTEMI